MATTRALRPIGLPCSTECTLPIPDTGIPRTRPRPGRRRAYTSSASISTFASILLLLCLLCAPSFAFHRPSFQERRPQLDPREKDIIYDSRQPPLERRQFSLDPSSSTEKASKPTSRSGSSSTAEAETTESASSGASESTTTNGIVSAPQPSDSTLPRAFDGGLGQNFTQPSCPTFLKDMIRNETFISCLPFSVLLQNSIAFFNVARNSSTLNPVLSSSCNIMFSACSALMASYASALQGSSACYEDYTRQSPTVQQAYSGLVSYDILYQASCIKATPSASNNQSGDYCFSDAITNTSSPSDSYIYYLPLGMALPATSTPTCSQCLKDTMGKFAESAGNKSQPLRLTYGNAASLVNQQCGPNYVNQNVPGASGGSGAAMASVPSPGGVAFALLVILALINTFDLV